MFGGRFFSEWIALYLEEVYVVHLTQDVGLS